MRMLFELLAESRTLQGKGASRRLRRVGKTPAILYGGGQPPQALALDHTRLLQMLDDERFYSTILNVKIDGQAQPAILRDVQRHPAKNAVLHLDLQRVLENEKLRMRIPLHFTGEGACVGVKTQGGILSHLLTDVEVLALPKDLPEYIEVDVSELGLNQTLHLSNLKLPEGVQLWELAHGRDLPVVAVHAPRVEEAETPAAEAAPAEGAAPAAAESAAGVQKEEGGKK